METRPVTKYSKLFDVDEGQVRLLFGSARFVVFAAIAVAAIFLFTLEGHIPAELLYSWGGVTVVASLARLWLALKFEREFRDGGDFRWWLGGYFVLLLIHTAVLGGSVLVIFPASDTSLQLMMIIVVLAVASGGAVTLATYLPAAFVFTLLMLSALAARFVLDPAFPDALGLLAGVYMVFLFGVSVTHNRFVLRALRYQRESENFIALSSEKSLHLRKNEEQLRLITDSLPAAVTYIDNDERYLYVNKVFEDLFNLDRETAIGMRVIDVIGEEAYTRFKPIFRQAQSGKNASFEAVRDFPGAGEIYAHVEFVPDFDESGEIRGMFTLLTDVTEAKNAEMELRRAKDTAEMANTAKSDFLANMSHELRTPLNAIIGFSEVLNAGIPGKLNLKQTEYVRDIHRSGDHLLELINDVLDISKIEAGKGEIVNERIEIAPMVESAVAFVKKTVESKRLKLDFRIAPNQPDLIADRRMLKQILINLISNAVKFTHDGGRITIGSRITENGAEIFVRDTGIGIQAEDIPKALAKFEQVDEGMARDFDGTGLGLPLAKAMTELHGGELIIDSVFGEGTTVTVTFTRERLYVPQLSAIN